MCNWLAGESCYSCSADCGACTAEPPPDQCDELPVHGALPLAAAETTSDAASAVDLASCGDRATGPIRLYEWTAPDSGVYQISATGSFPTVLAVYLDDCDGHEEACNAGDAMTGSSVTVGLPPERSVAIQVAGMAGTAGDFELDIAKLPDRCGDGVCEAGEMCDACPSDCGICYGSDCGDGVCQPYETAESCPLDCGPYYCGDGVCEPDESLATCGQDCGANPP